MWNPVELIGRFLILFGLYATAWLTLALAPGSAPAPEPGGAAAVTLWRKGLPFVGAAFLMLSPPEKRTFAFRPIVRRRRKAKGGPSKPRHENFPMI